MSLPYADHGLDLSSSLNDGNACAQDHGQRCALECAAPATADLATCVAAWHAALHWLRYNDEPVITCLLGRREGKCWPLTSAVDATTSLGELREQVQRQWREDEAGWLDRDDATHVGLADQLRCHAVLLHGASDPGQTEFALIHERGRWVVDCDASRFSESYQRFAIGLWTRLLAAMADQPETLLSALDALSDGALHDGAVRAHMAGPDAPIAGNLVERFAARVAEHPHKVAVIDGEGRIGFAELDALAERWAQALHEAGAGVGDFVGVCFGRNRRMVAAQLAVLKIGAAFVPMDAQQPAARLQAMADDADMRFVLAEADCVAPIRAALAQTRCLDIDALPAERGPSRPRQEQTLASDDLAYAIFTSGSTGRPKGVKVGHGNLLNFVGHIAELVDADDVVSQFAPFTFDASVAEIHSTLLNGLSLVILPAALIDDPERLQAYMSEHRVSFSAFPPQYAKHLSPERLPYQRTLLTAGSAPDHELIRRWQPHLQYVNAYGPTETTILSTAWHARHLPDPHEPIAIGEPIANTAVRVVNRFNHALPRGAIGELLIGGAGVTHGYLKREDMTRDKFLSFERMRWYRSGDLSCLDERNRLIFAGRVDDQIKLRGHRLEPGEVEAALRQLPGVGAAAVVAVDLDAGKQLVGFCAGAAQPEDAVRAALGQALPAWALPNRLVWLDALPLTVNGKTDYRALRERLAQAAAPQPEQGGDDHADELEQQIARIWSGVLQQPQVSREDNFVHLGGDSLTSLVVMSALKRLGYHATSAQLLARPRLADFAELLRRGGRHAQRDYASVHGSAPLSPIQGWFFDLDLGNPGDFCQTLAFESAQPLDLERLRRAFAQLADYHDQLRARFVRLGARGREAASWRQDIQPDAGAAEGFELPPLIVRDLAEAELDAAAARCRDELAGELDLAQAPLFRIAVLRTAQRTRVVWVLHHLLVDTVSHGILLDDLRHLYDADAASAQDVLPGKSLAYLDWSQRLNADAGREPARQLAQWSPLLEAVAATPPLPIASVRGAAGEAIVGEVVVAEHRLSREDSRRLLEQAPDCYRQSAEELVLAATYLALARTLGAQRVAIDVEWHGRDEEYAGAQGLDRTVGWFTSVHPLALAVPAQTGADALGDWLVELKETRAAVPARGRDFYALRYLAQDPALRAAFAAYRAPQVLFNFSGVIQRQQQGWRTVPMAAIELGAGNASPYALSVEGEIRDGELILSLYHDPAGWPGDSAGRFGPALIQALREIVAHCCDPAKRRWTPADFPLAGLDRAQAAAVPADAQPQGLYPLTDMQRTMHRHPDTYQVQMVYRMPRAFDGEAWSRAAADWIARHDCLRTVVREVDGLEPQQLVLAHLAFEPRVHRAAAGEGAALAQRLQQQARLQPVRLERAPLFELQAIDDGGEHFHALLSIHHLIHDGWSIDLLLADLLQSYRHHLGEAVPLPAAPLAGMADVVAQQRRLQADPAWLAHWTGLPWAPLSAQLPSALPVETAAQDTRLFTASIDRELGGRVRARASQSGVTANSLWLAGYACLLRCLGGQAQVRCGVIQSGRMEDIAGVETITGCCVNTLPLVLDIDGERALDAVVASVDRQLARMREGAAFPLSQIHEAVKPRLDDELFATLFNIESHRYGERQDAPRPQLVGGYESTNYRFIFGLIERQDGDGELEYGVRIGYDAGLFDEASIAMWLDLYQHLVGLLLDGEGVRWSEAELLPQAWRQRLLHEWNATDHAYSDQRCLHELFAEQAARTPQATALVFDGQRLSYAELDARGNRLAQHLRTLGVGPDRVVGLCAERSLEMIVGVLGILKAGGAWVPLDPELPAQRLAAMVADIGVDLVLTQHHLREQALAQLDGAVRTLELDADWARIAAHDAVAPDSGVGPDDLIYVIFTSGSTGKPKASMNQHRSLVNLMQWLQASYGMDASDVVLQKTPLSFDVSVMEIFWPLLNGATLVIAKPGGHRDPAYLGAMVREHGVTTLNFVPSMLQVFLDEDELRGCASLRRLFASGEALPGAMAARFLATSDAALYNLFGPTETAIEASGCAVERADSAIVPIGRPLWNTRLYVLDERLRPLPVGVGGELFIGGVAVGRGYLGQPQLTAERFLDSPFVAGERLYRTGDLARWRADGTVEYLGRLDHQVKVRGFRIELGEIEHALAAHEQVRQALVAARDDGARKQLVAYVVPRQWPADDAARSRLIGSFAAKLKAELPEYMVPAAFVLIEAIPRNANGKADRARLPEPDHSAYAHSAFVEPQGELETALWEVWKQVLGSDRFGVDDSFYAIGGDSILAIQVVSRAGKRGIALTPRLLTEEKTIRQIASRLSAAAAPAATPAVAVVVDANAEEASKGEQRLLPIQARFLQADRAEHGRYVQYADVALADGVGLAQLQAALLALVSRHDALRLKFRESAGGWMAQYRAEALSAEAWDDAIVEIDGDAAQAPATAREHIHAQVDAAMAELDIKQGRLLRWLWLRDANGSRLLWVMHHLVVDVVSWQVLAEDLATALDQLGRGEAVRLARKGATGYQDWAARLHDYAYSGELDAEKRYWLEQLRAPAAALAFDGDDEAPAQSSSRQHELRLPPALTRRLLDQATSRHGLRIHELLTAALGRALGQWQSVDAIRIDLESHGRPDLSDVPGFDGVDLSQTVGWFTALYPLRLERLRDDLRSQLRAAGAALAAVPHAGIGFGVLNELARDEDLEQAREGRESQVLFNYLGAFDPDRGGSRIGARRRRSHALGVEGGVEHGALTLRIDYSERQFQAASVAALAAQLERALAEIADDDGGPGAGVGVGTQDDDTSDAPWSLSDCTPAELQDLRRHYPALQDLYPCTGMQQGLLLMSDGANPDGVYLTQLRLTLDGADPQRLRAAWVELVRRHPVLRTAFLDRGGERLLQAVMREVALPWREIDLSALAEDQRDAELERALDDERRRAFALGEAPPMRVLLARLDARRHCLAWTHHHALIDGWSMGLLAQDLFQVYAGHNEDAAPPPYRDYIAWLESRDHQAAADYWQRYLDGLPLAASAALSARLDDDADTDATGPSEQRAHVLELPVALTAQLDRALKHEGVSLGTAILAAWGLLQSKYSAEEEVLFGYTTSGRPPELDGIERMVGLFINSLPLRLRIDPAQTLSAWLRQVQSMQLDHGDHGFLPLAAIQRACGARAGQALFNALVVVENFPLDRSLPSMDGEQLRVLDARGVERSDFPLNLIVYPGSRLTVKLAYQSRQFGDAAARAMLDRLGHLLAGFAHGFDQRVGQLSPLSADERERAVREWNRSEVDYPLHACAHELFQQQAEALGDGDAIVCGDERWSWNRLSARVAEVAAWLRRGGVRPGDRVALALPKEPELIAAILAIMRAGAAYVPVALDCPPERLAFIAGDAGIGRLLTVRAHAALADGSGLSALCLDEIDAAATDSSADVEALQDAEPQSSESTAYLIYTSGTTGTPKGVALSHRNLVNFSLWLGGAGLYGRGQGFTQFAPHTFDASIGEIFGALLAGATLHLLSDALIQEPHALAAYLGEHAIAFAAFPPPYLQQIDPAQVPANLSILTAGSAPTVELARAWSARCRYVNAYGPTETTVLSSAWMPAADDAELAAGRLSIGRPISNTTMYVVDTAGQLCAPGLLGEIWIGGAGVAQGYVNRPEQTAQQFLDDPWRAGERVYRTGDHGRWLDDGRIEFIGRRDRQIKLRGFRIELGEIENRLREHAGVRDAAVLAHGDGAERRLLAWVVRHEDARAQPQAEFLAELREGLRRALPEYMLPQATMELAQLPLTGNGKLDAKALPVPQIEAGGEGEYIAPRDAIETAIAEVWGAVLKLPAQRIGIDADFFALGGQSLLAMRATAQLRERLGLDVGVADLLQRPVLAELAAQLRGAARDTLPPIGAQPRAADAALPLSFAQQRLWFLSQMQGVSQSYHVPGVLRLRGALDRAALKRALDRIVARHEALRTRFELLGDDPVQRIDPPHVGFALSEHDLRGRDDREARLQALVERETGAPFDLETGPLARGVLVALGADEHALIICMHHIVTDAWSLELTIRELVALYDAFSAGQDDPLPPLAVQYADYVDWQRRHLGGEWLQRQGEYWRGALAGAPALLELPTDRPRPAEQRYDGELVGVRLDRELSDALKRLSQDHGTTLYTTLLSAWALVLGRLSGQHDVVIGSPVANRLQAQVEPLIGFFVNTLALRVDLSGEPSLAQVIERVKQRALDAQAHQQMPFEQVVEALQPPRSLAHTPLFQVMFNWLGEQAQTVSARDLRIELQAPDQVAAKFDLSLDLGESDGCIGGGVEFATALFDRASVQRWLGYFERVLRAMVADAAQPARRVPLLDAAERALIAQCNDTHRPELYAQTWVELFDAQAARAPERIVAECGEQTLTHGELQRRAGRLAAALREAGAGPERVIAVLDKRGLDLLVAIAAVLKSGAAYLPLDPAHPPLRWREILDEAQPQLLLLGDSLGHLHEQLDTGATTGRVRSLAELSEAAPVDAPALPAPGLDDLAYVIFTSGSTGKPKGVMIEHRGMVNNMRSKFEPLSLSSEDAIAQTASQCFDISVWQLLTAPLLGARTCILDSDTVRDPESLLDALERHGVTVWEPVPSVMQAALPYAKPLPALRWVLPTGEALSRELVARWFEQYPDVPLMNAYGPAECSDDVAFEPILAPVARVAIGAPVANAALHVLDDALEPAPLGAVGEIAVSGPVVGRGYFHRPDETRAAFVANPHAAHERDGRLYLTGDLGRRLGDGRIEYVGRKDFQVKIRGFRVELGEIESALARHPAVREAAVVAAAGAQEGKQLVAFVVAAAPVSPDTLKLHLQALLPDYMVPAAIVLAQALPLSANGKVDRAELAAQTVRAQARGERAPNGRIEVALARMWQDLLQLERVHRDDHFFELGGQWLQAMGVLARLRRELKAELTLAALREAPVLKDLARTVGEALAGRGPARTKRAPGWTPLALPALRRWQLQREAARTRHATCVLRLDGGFDRAALERALQLWAARFDALRLRVAEFDEEPLRAPAAAPMAALQVAELGEADDREAALAAYIEQAAYAEFDLADAAPLRASLLRLGEREHALVLTVHALAADRWQPERALAELARLYHQAVEGEGDAAGPAAPAAAEAPALADEHAGYWRERLAAAPALIELPFDRARPLRQDDEGAVVPLRLDAELTAAARALGAAHGASLDTVLLAAWSAALARLSGQSDFVLGRTRADAARGDAPAGAVDLHALRIELPETADVATWIAALQTRIDVDALSPASLGQVVEAAQPAPALAHTPLFQAVFDWRGARADAVALGDCAARLQRLPRARAGFELSLELGEGEGGLSGALTYARALLDAATAERWAGYLEHTLRAMIADPAAAVAHLDTIGAGERERLLVERAGARRDYPRQLRLHDLFEAQARETPYRIAVTADDGVLTYAQLDARANALARWLRERGVCAGTRVALCLERGVDMVVALYATLKAGGCYVPLDPDYPRDRVAWILENSAPPVVLTHAALVPTALEGLPLDGIELLCMDREREWMDYPQHALAAEGNDAQPHDACYVIYTSGSTGRPKGVVNEHRGVVNRLLWMQEEYGLGERDAVLQKTPYSFDVSVWEFFWPLMVGAKLVMARPNGHKDPAYLGQVVRDAGVTTLHFVPSMLQVFLAIPEAVAGCGRVARVICSGEALPLALARSFHDYLPNAELHNLYGPTEAAVDVTAWPCRPGDARASVPIGRPIANTRMYVLDRLGQLAPTGATGELYIAGVQVARGYLGQPELTAERFLDDPFVPGERMYRTGDLGRWAADGAIEYLGRTDFQVKIRGFRIELGEIENALLQHAEVREAVVLAREGAGGDKQLFAYVALAQLLPAEALKEHLRARLPDYMVPAQFVILDALPLSANGKADRKALLALEVQAEGAAYRAPVGRIELALARIWQELLQVERVGRDDAFFDLGGHSLLAARVIARLRRELKVEVNIAELFAFPVFEDFARAVAQAIDSELPPIVPVKRDGAPMPLSFAQQRLWFLAQMEGVAETYHVPAVLRLRGGLDRAALRRALDRIVDRHETLRTRFVLVDGEPMQRIDPPGGGFALDECDLRGVAEAEARLRELMDEEACAPFDLAAGPMVRGRLVALADDDHAVLITQHHIVTDEWSLDVTLREFGALYNAYRGGGEDPLPALPVQYADYAAWQHAWLSGERLQSQVDYWAQALAGAPALLELPTDRPRPAQQAYDGAVYEFALDRELTDALKALSRRCDATLFMTLLAAWSVVLGRLSGQRDLVVGSPIANRMQVEIEPLIGLFINTLALRVDLSADPSGEQLLEQVRQRTLSAQRHQQMPFEQVVEVVQPPRSLAYSSIFQVMINWKPEATQALQLDGLTLAPQRAPYVLSKFDLTLDLAEADGRIVGSMEYATALFDRDTIARHVGYLTRVLQALAADASRPVRAIELLGDDEKALLHGFNDTYRPELIDRTWPRMFLDQVALTPERIAVECEQHRLTYAELEARSAALAQTLRAQGAGPGSIVALLDQRGTDLLTMIVATLRAGAAYLPLDPTHPPQRWLEILDEAQPGLLWVGEALAMERRWLKRKWKGERVRSLAELDAAAVADPAPLPLPLPALDDLAYVIFTSGSTGKPKGVMIEHRGMINNMRSKFAPLSLSGEDVIAQTASQCFDISVWQFLTAPLLGARVSIIGSETTRDPGALLDRLDAQGVTVWEPVPSVMQAVLPYRKPLPALRWVLPTGEALPRELVTRWFEQYPDVPLMNAYGPAECSDDVSFQPILGPVERVLIGTPVANAHLHIVDEQLRLVPLGAVGEIGVSGPVVGRGYLNRPDETESKFRPNPYARHEADRRLYLTGDLGRRLPDGGIEYVGRKDFQVKIRGFRIELGEIESCLAQHPAVTEAIVTARELGHGDKQLVAYVVQDGGVGVEALKAHLRNALPDYMVPAAIVMLEAMPLNANGKVDRNALPAPSMAALQQAEYEAPASAAERAIAETWQELLELPQVGRDDSFFELGGNSILLIRMLGRLRERDLDFSVTDVYQLRTVKALAEAAAPRAVGVDEWLRAQGWAHRRVALDPTGQARSALLLAREGDEPARRGELQRVLAAAGDAPDFVRIEDDPDAVAATLESAGLAALALPAPALPAVARFDAQRAQWREALRAAPAAEAFGFGAMQRSLLAWNRRDSVEVFEIAGWYGAEELRAGFAALCAEQELLRAMPDAQDAQWRLLAPQALAAAPLPHLDLRGADRLRQDLELAELVESLHRDGSGAPLAYSAGWVSLSDTRHCLVFAVDHLIWDGVSARVLRERLLQHLWRQAQAPKHGYRDYLQAVQAACTAQARDAADQVLGHAALAQTLDATARRLQARAAQPLRVFTASVPVAAKSTAAEQAFETFKRWALGLTGLERVSIVLNHHGRELGERAYFDLFGLFLDKIPFAVAADTSLVELSDRTAFLQSQGLHYATLEAAGAGPTRAPTLPALAEEVQFNFQTEAASALAAGLDEDYLLAKLGDFRGLLFEAAVADGRLIVHCACRSDDPEAAQAALEAACRGEILAAAAEPESLEAP
ncbi:non-ribosomal peptide synthase/polyketide synthase [Lysobacter yananisis]|uniref:non-ribosomal peptide synthase/polyketide synthase n=1 Tax=Lysobacter yananisis TaxID=1003114 RepID=UPI00300B21D2